MIDDALLASREIPTSLRDARAFLIRHRSRDMHGRATAAVAELDANDDHFSLPASCVADARRWLEERLTTVTS